MKNDYETDSSQDSSSSDDLRLVPPPHVPSDLTISESLDFRVTGLAGDRLLFDGYTLSWLGSSPASFIGFSGMADESAKESVKDIGPTPQGKYAVDPANIEILVPSDDWGEHRVKLEPYKETVTRMSDCFKVIRTGMYIHGGTFTGTHGCIELNDDADEAAFFKKLKDYGKKIELEVSYVSDRENITRIRDVLIRRI